jgi:hypothetical protein
LALVAQVVLITQMIADKLATILLLLLFLPLVVVEVEVGT